MIARRNSYDLTAPQLSTGTADATHPKVAGNSSTVNIASRFDVQCANFKHDKVLP